MSDKARYNFDQNILKLNEPLPRVPSELIRLALEDLEAAEKRDDTVIDMYMWSFKSESDASKCRVCLAGAVMRQRCVNFDEFMEHNVEMIPSNFSIEESLCLVALNDFRLGLIATGLAILDIQPPHDLQHRMIVRDYHDNVEGFKDDMRNMASYLEGFGL